jgi:hypothetical protein
MNVSVSLRGFSLTVEYQCSRCHRMRPAAEFIGRAGKVMKTCERCRKQKAKQK